MDRQRPERLVLILAVLVASLWLAACTAIQPTPEEAEAAWAKSAHADKKAESFKHWNKARPPEIPADCAKCHSTPGYLDFHGADSSVAGVVDAPAPTGTTVECEACHGDATGTLTAAALPSGVQLTRLGANANCYDCHQGLASGSTVETAIAGIDLDVVNTELTFVDIHANAAGPILYGREAGAGYEYAGQAYSGRYPHVPGFDDCIACHDAHSLRLTPQNCAACHVGVKSSAALPQLRVSSIDYDGDGDVSEGIKNEIETLRIRLLETMQQYVQGIEGAGSLTYSKNYPYFLNGDGEPFARWTPRLLRAAYNFQLVTKGAGSFAHNPDYVLQLLYDSIADLNGDLRGATRPAAR